MWGGIDPWDHRLGPRFVGIVDMEGFLIRVWDLNFYVQPSPPADSMSPSQAATSQCGWGFHTVRGGIDPGDPRFRPQVVGARPICRSYLQMAS